MLRFERYKRTRFWAVWDGPTLIAVVVYKKGAKSVIAHIEKGVPPCRI